MVLTGIVSGDTGPTIIILNGKTKCAMFNDDYIVQKGLKSWSTIIMEENAFMTNNVWY